MTTYYQFVGGNLSGQILARKGVEGTAHGPTKNLPKEKSERKLKPLRMVVQKISQKKGAKGN